MIDSSKPYPFIKVILSVLAALVLAIVCVIKVKIALLLGAALFCFVVFWLLSKYLDEKRIVLIFIFMYPLLPYLLGFDVGGGLPVFRAHRIVVLGLIVFLLSKGLLVRYYTDFTKTNLFSYPLFFVILASFLTTIFSESIVGTMFFIFSFVFELLLLSVVVFSIFKTRDDIELLVKTLCLSALILCVFGIIEKITQYNIYTTMGAFRPELGRALNLQLRGGSVRSQGPFDHSIAFGGYLAALLPLIMYRYTEKFIHFNISLALVIGAIVATQSRSALLAACLICVFYFLFINKKNFALIPLLLIPLLIVASSDIAGLMAGINPLASTSQDAVSSTAARYMQFIHMVDVIKKNPVLGVGLIPPPGIMLQYNVIESSIDNFYLLYTYFFGIIGILAYFCFMLSTLIKPFTAANGRFRNDNLMMLVFIGIVIFYLINTIVALWSFHFIFWILLGILARLIVNTRNESC